MWAPQRDGAVQDGTVETILRNSQLKEIKKLKYAEPYNFKRKANEDQFKFNTKVIDTMAEVSGFL